MSIGLDPLGGFVPVGGVQLRTPGLEGTAESYPPASQGMRAEEASTDALEQALVNESMQPQETVVLTNTTEVEVGDVATRSTSFGEPAIEAVVPMPGDSFGQVVLYVDEAGVVTWNFPVTESLELDTTRGSATRTYVLRRYVPPPTPGAEVETRGLSGAIGKKLIKVLVFPLVDPVIGAVGEHFAERWEEHKRPYRVRSFTPDDYASPDPAHLYASADNGGGDGWDELGKGRALLMVHGTFSRAHTGFGRLDPKVVADLHRRYEGRVFAFDHFTLSKSPKDNVEWLLDHMPEGAKLELDIVCHSRGGLVSRVLAEKQSELSLGSRQLAIRRIVFVAAPNHGTILTDAKYIGDLIDSYTNVLNFFPDNGVTEIIEGVITVVKHLALGTIAGLDGLECMLPTGRFLQDWLNTGKRDDKQYFAVTSNYEPVNAGLRAWAADRLMDGIFKAENDLVVPTSGVFEQNGSGFFPIEAVYEFDPKAGVAHTTYFGQKATQQSILGWLT